MSFQARQPMTESQAVLAIAEFKKLRSEVGTGPYTVFSERRKQSRKIKFWCWAANRVVTSKRYSRSYNDRWADRYTKRYSVNEVLCKRFQKLGVPCEWGAHGLVLYIPLHMTISGRLNKPL